MKKVFQPLASLPCQHEDIMSPPLPSECIAKTMAYCVGAKADRSHLWMFKKLTTH